MKRKQKEALDCSGVADKRQRETKYYLCWLWVCGNMSPFWRETVIMFICSLVCESPYIVPCLCALWYAMEINEKMRRKDTNSWVLECWRHINEMSVVYLKPFTEKCKEEWTCGCNCCSLQMWVTVAVVASWGNMLPMSSLGVGDIFGTTTFKFSSILNYPLSLNPSFRFQDAT